MTPDHINGIFEGLGAALLLIDVLTLRRDRMIAGVHYAPRFFFTAWGLWNLYYYPALAQWWSFVGGCALVLVNAIWLVQLAVYPRRPMTDLPFEWRCNFDVTGDRCGRMYGGRRDG